MSAKACALTYASSTLFQGNPMIPPDTHLQIGSLLFDGLDQIDLTGPFEVLSRIPNATYRLYGKTIEPVRDLHGLRLTPDAAWADAPQLDVLHVPGGFGQEALMEDEDLLAWISEQAAGVHSVFSVCTGALLCGAAGLLKGRRAPHWRSAIRLLRPTPLNDRIRASILPMQRVSIDLKRYRNGIVAIC